MRILILYNLAVLLKKGTQDDLVCEQEIKIIVPLVAELLRYRGYEVETLETSLNLWDELTKRRGQFDIVLNLAEGFGGANTNEVFVPAMLEALDLPFTGASLRNMVFTMDKEKTNIVLGSYGIPTPKRRMFHSAARDLTCTDLRFPVIVKPVREEASIGITYDSVVSSQNGLVDRVSNVLSLYQQPALVEEFIEGREISVGVVGNRLSLQLFPPLEFLFEESVLPLRRIRSYEYKWGGGKEWMSKAVLPEDLTNQLLEYTRIAFLATDCQDYARMDYRVTEGGDIFLLEVNHNPGIGPNTHGLNNTLTMMASFNGYSFEDLIEMIILAAKERYGL